MPKSKAKTKKSQKQEIVRLRKIIRMVAEYPLGMPKKLWRKVLDEAHRDPS